MVIAITSSLERPRRHPSRAWRRPWEVDARTGGQAVLAAMIAGRRPRSATRSSLQAGLAQLVGDPRAALLADRARPDATLCTSSASISPSANCLTGPPKRPTSDPAVIDVRTPARTSDSSICGSRWKAGLRSGWASTTPWPASSNSEDHSVEPDRDRVKGHSISSHGPRRASAPRAPARRGRRRGSSRDLRAGEHVTSTPASASAEFVCAPAARSSRSLP